MQDQKYKHSKWFIGAIVLLTLGLVLFDDRSDPGVYAGVNTLLLGLLLAAVVVYWPVDYLLHKKATKDSHARVGAIDPGFKRKRNALLAAIVVVPVLIWISTL